MHLGSGGVSVSQDFVKSYHCRGCFREFHASNIPLESVSHMKGLAPASDPEARKLASGICPVCGNEVVMSHFQIMGDIHPVG